MDGKPSRNLTIHTITSSNSTCEPPKELRARSMFGEVSGHEPSPPSSPSASAPPGRAKKPISSGKRRWLTGGHMEGSRLASRPDPWLSTPLPAAPAQRGPDQIPGKDKHQRAFVWTRRRTTGNPTYARHIHRSGAVGTTQESGYRRGWLWRTWSCRAMNHVASSRLLHVTPQTADMLSLVPNLFLDAG